MADVGADRGDAERSALSSRGDDDGAAETAMSLLRAGVRPVAGARAARLAKIALRNAMTTASGMPDRVSLRRREGGM